MHNPRKLPFYVKVYYHATLRAHKAYLFSVFFPSFDSFLVPLCLREAEFFDFRVLLISFASLSWFHKSTSVSKCFAPWFCGFSVIHLSDCGFNCHESFLSKVQQSRCSKAEISNMGFDYFLSSEKAISNFCKVADVYPVVLFSQTAISVFNCSIVSYDFSLMKCWGYPLFLFFKSFFNIATIISVNIALRPRTVLSLSFHGTKLHLVLWWSQTFWKNEHYDSIIIATFLL